MFSPLMLERIREHIIPLIIESVIDACAAYDSTERPNGDNFSSPYTFGTGCYGILRSRLERCLDDDSCFRLESINGVARIIWQNREEIMRFFIYKVDALTRIPNGAGSVKSELRQPWIQGWLSPEFEQKALAPHGYVINLGFDASIENGIGDITLDRLRHLSGNEYEVVTLHKFEIDYYGPGRGSKKTAIRAKPEKIRRSAPAYDPYHDSSRAVSE